MAAPKQDPAPFVVGWCFIRYRTDSTAEETLAHYRQQFGEKGRSPLEEETLPNVPGDISWSPGAVTGTVLAPAGSPERDSVANGTFLL